MKSAAYFLAYGFEKKKGSPNYDAHLELENSKAYFPPGSITKETVSIIFPDFGTKRSTELTTSSIGQKFSCYFCMNTMTK